MIGFSLVASFFYVLLGAGLMGFAAGHAQLAYLESKSKI